MPSQSLRRMAMVGALAGLSFLSACSKKSQIAKLPPTTPPLPAPTATLTASPAMVKAGSAATLTWSTQNASQVTISGLGAVQPNGSQQVTPSESTTYDLSAKGAGGETNASARVTIAPTVVANLNESELFAADMKDIFFDYDKYAVRANESSVVRSDVQFLETHPDIRVVLAGHCDERGSEEYNLALGESRAQAVKQALVNMGVSSDRIQTISYGKERPFCTAEDERCWQQNRRAHFAMTP